MRNLRSNTQCVHYRNMIGETDIVDKYGNRTGSAPVYGELECAQMCVSPSKGSSDVRQFGSFEDYDRTITTSECCSIDENTVIWLDGADTNGAYNYKVTLKAPWKNSVTYAIKKVNVSQGEGWRQIANSNKN